MKRPKPGEPLTHSLPLPKLAVVPNVQDVLARARRLGLKPHKPQPQQAPKAQKPRRNGDKNTERKDTPSTHQHSTPCKEESNMTMNAQAQPAPAAPAAAAPSNGQPGVHQAPQAAQPQYAPQAPQAAPPQPQLSPMQYLEAQGFSALGKLAQRINEGQPLYVAPQPAPSRFDGVRVANQALTCTMVAGTVIGTFAACMGIKRAFDN